MSTGEKDYAIVVGLAQYEIKGDNRALYEAPLAFYDWLVNDPNGPRLPEANVIGVGNVGGTDHNRAEVDKAFERILHGGRRLYIYMSGRGAKVEDHFCLLSPGGPGGTVYPAMPLFEYAEGARVRGGYDEVVFFADCMESPIQSKKAEPPTFMSDWVDAPENSHLFAWAEKGIPRFTDTLLRGLRGEAANREGYVTTSSLERYLRVRGVDHFSARGDDLILAQPDIEKKREPRSERVIAHADDPAVVDELGRRPFAEVIASRIIEVRERQDKRAKARDASDLAFMVHIHGPWGSGKTSVLNFLRAYLREKDWVVVEFNAWRHQRMRPPWWALIQTIYKDAMRQLGFWRRQLLSLKWLLWRVRIDFVPVLLTLVLLGIALYLFKENVELAPKIITAIAAAAGVVWASSRSLVFGSARAAQTYTELRSDPLGPIVTLFRNLIRTIRRPVVIFVDDLDRCDSKYVIDLLEGIQTLFRSAPVTYVVAADRKWICSSFDQTYESFGSTIGEPGRPLGYLFLEKVFQVSASVPRLSEDVQKAYWAGLLQRGEAVDPATLEEKRKEAEEKAAAKVKDAHTHEQLEQAVKAETGDAIDKAAIRAAAAKQITTPEAQKETEHRLQPFAQMLEPNPRAMKRLVNAYGLHQAAHFLEGRSVAPEALARWTIIELRWPLLADHLCVHPEAISAIGKDNASGVPEKLAQLLGNAEVREVAKGLDQDDIRSITR